MKKFTRKNGNQKGGGLYKWSPDTTLVKKVNDEIILIVKPFFCSTNIGTQGNDQKSTYSYIPLYVNGEVIKAAYVQCNYVE